MSRFLLEPCNNTLSHIAKCLALQEALEARGHEVVLAVSAARAAFLDRIGHTRYCVLPDLQDADHGAKPTFSWFRPARVEACVRAEEQLLRQLRPDAVLGVFRFTGALSAALAGVPYDSLICGSMTPAFTEVPGFDASEAGADAQVAALAFFRQACARRMQPALAALGLPPVADIWELLVGRRTYLWDYPEFQPLSAGPGYIHVGPIAWSKWPRPTGDDEIAALDALEGHIAYVAFGTGQMPTAALRRVVDILLRAGYSVALARGGQSPSGDWPACPGRLATFDFLPADAILARASLAVCHGGQGLVFEALRHRVPLLVLPLQPEQAQNGRCLERLRCGRRLVRGVVYRNEGSEAETAFFARPVPEVIDDIAALTADPLLPANLAAAARDLGAYDGTRRLAALLEDSA